MSIFQSVAPTLEASARDNLTSLVKGELARIKFLSSAINPEQSVLRDRLEELGFLPGESLRVVAVAFPSGDPVAVRLGNTTFALRRHEAEMIYIDRHA